MRPKYSTAQRLKIIERVILHKESVSKVCREAGISRVLFYRWLHKYKEGFTFRKHPEKYHKFSPQEKLKLVERVIVRGEEVADVCREAGISRTIFYRWKKGYENARPAERVKALSFHSYQTPYHWRRSPQEYERAVLNLVARHPGYGIRKLLVNLPQVAGEPIVSHHGVQNILHRYHLSLYAQRLAYAKAQVSPVDRLVATFEQYFGRLFALSPERRAAVVRFTSATLLSTFTTIVFLGILGYFVEVAPVVFLNRPGLIFATMALLVGMVFFLYSMKYYFMLTLILSFSSRSVSLSAETKNKQNSNGGMGLWLWLARIFGLRNPDKNNSSSEAGGLTANLDHIKPERYPFISVQLPFYNEKKVASRIISACTSFDYPPSASSGQANFEVIVCDDSNDETVEIVNSWANHPQVKILRRKDRKGFKGGALSYALKAMDPRTEFVVVFDADFVPYPDTLMQFVKYFKATGGWDEEKDYKADGIRTMAYETNGKVEVSPEEQLAINNQQSAIINKSDIAVVAGYQWHVLNKSENWITRGVRTEYAGSYVVERPAQEILGAMKIIHGSVYCMRADVLKHFGWGTSITEDYELTLRIYEKGFRVVFTPYIQAPSECVSTLQRLIKQRMRWAEGHSFNTRKMFFKLLFGGWETRGVEDGGQRTEDGFQKTENGKQIAENQISVIGHQYQSSVFRHRSSKVWRSSPLTFSEKLEFLFLAPYYLQAFFFLVGTFAWIISETVFHERLPFWTALWGWSLILTNFLALPLVNAIGLFLEESEEKDYLGILSFVVLCYLVVPFQAYAAIKGFLEPQEGTWFRTPKTGNITDVFSRGRFYRWLTGILSGRRPAVAPLAGADLINHQSSVINPYLSLATANNRFSNFTVRPKRLRWVSKTVLAILLIISSTILSLTRGVPEVLATNPNVIQYLRNDASTVITAVTAWTLTNAQDSDADSIIIDIDRNEVVDANIQFEPGLDATTPETKCSSTPDGRGFILDTPFGTGGSITQGAWTFYIEESDNGPNREGHIDVCVYRTTISSGGIGTATLLFQSEGDSSWSTTDTMDGAANSITQTTSSQCLGGCPIGQGEYLYVEYWYHNTTKVNEAEVDSYIYSRTAGGSNSFITTPGLTIPENLLLILMVAPFIPLMVLWMKRRNNPPSLKLRRTQ